MNTKTQTQKHYRQGDVLVSSVDSVPDKLTKVAREGGRLVLAHGKSTGHSHAVPTARCDLFQDPNEPGAMFLKVNAAKAELVHDEHSTIALPKGVYRVTRQREFSNEAARRVED